MVSLKTFLRDRSADARKLFGKKEISIILKQLDGVTLTQSEKNRLSKDIRKKFAVIKELSSFQEDFSLKKGSRVKKIIRAVLETILHDELKDRILAVLLFGSRVRGMVTKRSDMDICVVFQQIDIRESTTFRIRVLGKFDDDVDVQVFNVLPQKIKRAIATKHRLLYKTKEFDNVSFTVQHLKMEPYRRGET